MKNEKNYEYKRENVRRLVIPINRRTEADLLEWIERQPQKATYIKELIWREIEEYTAARAAELRNLKG